MFVLTFTKKKIVRVYNIGKKKFVGEKECILVQFFSVISTKFFLNIKYKHMIIIQRLNIKSIIRFLDPSFLSVCIIH